MTLLEEYNLEGENFGVYWTNAIFVGTKIKIKDIPSNEIIDYLNGNNPKLVCSEFWVDLFNDVLYKRRINSIKKIMNRLC